MICNIFYFVFIYPKFVEIYKSIINNWLYIFYCEWFSSRWLFFIIINYENVNNAISIHNLSVIYCNLWRNIFEVITPLNKSCKNFNQDQLVIMFPNLDYSDKQLCTNSFYCEVQTAILITTLKEQCSASADLLHPYNRTLLISSCN